MERREVLDLLEWIPVRELFDQPKIQSVLETKIECPGNMACHSNGKLWVAENAGLLKLFNFNKQFGASKQSSKATGASFTLKNFGVDKGTTDIDVTRTGDLVYGIKLENSVFIFKKDKAELLINLFDWKFFNFCIAFFDGLLVCMVDERKYRCRVVRLGSEKTQIIQYDHLGKSLYTSGMLDNYIEENKNRDICLSDCDDGRVIVTNRTGEFRFRYNGTTSSQKGDTFCPVGIASDSAANILVADTFMIHTCIIDIDGRFLRFLNIVCSNPMRLAWMKMLIFILLIRMATLRLYNI